MQFKEVIKRRYENLALVYKKPEALSFFVSPDHELAGKRRV